ncbi:hypothetical protein GWK36_06375 [Caldichromatium japonicum]|uniref:Wadjet protein JetD C-terminal domain-containing protein n=1 Tax=Caldichromatium japonicum TaxID=2699430 RepID=A0A6G7VCP1_9GAMM|nr:Wadjet anti-phage system protein JetD domain-containing protein [Caldichromatium japonicum]QIK37670.1 hypothetical protein GWK36_06375 [Caldichromatium japonicum]
MQKIIDTGYGWEALAQGPWLNACQLYYWGDLDTHGFAILDGLRNHFPQGGLLADGWIAPLCSPIAPIGPRSTPPSATIWPA